MEECRLRCSKAESDLLSFNELFVLYDCKMLIIRKWGMGSLLLIINELGKDKLLILLLPHVALFYIRLMKKKLKVRYIFEVIFLAYFW